MDVSYSLWRGTKRTDEVSSVACSNFFPAAAVVIVGGLGEEIAMIR